MYNVRVAFFTIISTVFYGVIKPGISMLHAMVLFAFGLRIILFMNFVLY